MLTMNVDIMSPTVAELNEEKMHTDTQKKNLETSEYMNLKFSLTKEYFQVLSLTIIIFYTFFTHTTTKSDMILHFAQRMDTIFHRLDNVLRNHC